MISIPILHSSSHALISLTPLQIESLTMTSRDTIARLCNAIKALAAYGVQLFDTIILTAYDISIKYKVKELLNAEVMEHVAQESYEHSLHQNL